MNFNEESKCSARPEPVRAPAPASDGSPATPTPSYGRIVIVVFLQGGRPTFGPKAAEIAGRMYRNLYDHKFFVAGTAGNVELPISTRSFALPPSNRPNGATGARPSCVTRIPIAHLLAIRGLSLSMTNGTHRLAVLPRESLRVVQNNPTHEFVFTGRGVAKQSDKPVARAPPTISSASAAYSAVFACGCRSAGRYSPIAHNGFLNYDDDTYITNNLTSERAHVETVSGRSRRGRRQLSSSDLALSRARLPTFGVNPGAHHEINVLFHAANAVLFFCCSRGPRDSPGAASSSLHCLRFIPSTSSRSPGRPNARTC